MKKQSKEDRLKRLKTGRCPIHGIFMPQVGLHDIYSDPCSQCGEQKELGSRFIVGCPRKDCNIQAYTDEPYVESDLLPEFQYLIS